MAEAIYVRQSKDKKDSLSIEGQIDFCRRECSHPEAASVYTDRGFSGKNTKRPGFQQMMADVQAGKIEKIVVYRLDRLSRSITDFGELWQELEKYSVDFVSVNERFDTTTPVGRAMIYIIMVFAQLERETIAERVADNYYTRITKGSWPGGPAPYGMKNAKITSEDGRKVPTLEYTEEFDIVQEVFTRYALDDVSLGEIAKDLTARKIPCKKRKSWDNVAVARILHSPVYVMADETIYRYYQSKGVTNFSNSFEDFDGTSSAHLVGKRKGNERKYTDVADHVLSLTNFPGRIPADIWLLCQHKLDQNRQVGNAFKGKHTWLSGLLKCADCGYSLAVRLWKDRKYLCCSGRNNLHICDKKSFSLHVDEVEKAVAAELEKILDECNQEQVMIPDDSAAKYQEELRDVEAQIQNLVSLMKEANAVSMKYINTELEKLDLRKAELLNMFKNPAEDKKQFYQGIVFHKLNFEEKKLAAQAFIERINVADDGIEIVWKI